MTTINEIWRSFNRWQKRYLNRVISSKAGLHLWKFSELGEEPNLTKAEIVRRCGLKCEFFKGYLIDVSIDGPEYMQDHGRKLLTYQYPSRCNSSYGIWLYVADYGKDDFPSPFFSEQEISIFAPNIEIVDWASIWRVIPFDFAYLRFPYGKRLNPTTLKGYAEYIRNDLEFDGLNCKIDSSLYSRTIGCLQVRE